MSREELLLVIKESRKPKTDARNRMGCSENWYDSHYAIANTFTDGELDQMSESELNNLVKLADRMSEAFF